MPDLEAVGDAVTGGVVARMVEPDTGETADGHTREHACLNCGCELQGEFCHCCGQRGHVHRTLKAFWHDIAHSVLHLEGKIWRTLPMLAVRPGELTRRYAHGERVKFVSPLALFLFSVFLLFAVGSLTGGISPAAGSAQMQAELNDDIAENERAIAALRKERDEALRTGAPTSGVDARIADLQRELGVLRGLSSGEWVSNRRPVVVGELPRWLRLPIEQLGKNPDLTLYKLKTNAYKFSWALIPISVPFVWLLFPLNRRFHLYDHTVFVTYSLCFMTLLFIASLLFGAAGLASLASVLFLVPPVHMFLQLRGAYGLGTWGALWRTSLLVWFAFIAISLFISALVGIGAVD